MSAEVEKFLKALEDYYGSGQYSELQWKAIVRKLGHQPKAYLLDLYNQVIQTHSTTYRSLPDLAIISKVQGKMNPPDVYVTPTYPQIEYNPEVQEEIDEILAKKVRTEWSDVEQKLIKDKVCRGEATREEAWWLLHVGGEWKKMPESFEINREDFAC